MKIINYLVVETSDPDELRKCVMFYLREGWSLQGGVAVVALGEDDYLYGQAIVKFSEENNGDETKG